MRATGTEQAVDEQASMGGTYLVTPNVGAFVHLHQVLELMLSDQVGQDSHQAVT